MVYVQIVSSKIKQYVVGYGVGAILNNAKGRVKMGKTRFWAVLQYLFLCLGLVVIIVTSIFLWNFFSGNRHLAQKHAELVNREAQFIKQLMPNVAYNQLQEGNSLAYAFYPTDTQQQPLQVTESVLNTHRQAVLQKKEAPTRTVFLYCDVSQEFESVAHYKVYQSEYVLQHNDYQKQPTQEIDDVWLTADNQQIGFSDLFAIDTFNADQIAQLIIENVPSETPQETVASVTADALTTGWLKNRGFYFEEAGLSVRLSEGRVATVPYEAIIGYLKPSFVTSEQSALYQQKRAALNGSVQTESEPQQKPDMSETKKIALTFDDGPHKTRTLAVLDILKKYNVKATFFVLGSSVPGLETVLQREIAEGHEIGNHSWSHPDLTKVTAQQAREEFQKTQEVIFKAVNQYPKFMRPPYGVMNHAASEAIQSSYIMWNVDTLDWQTKDADAIAKEVFKNVKGGAIILMHDIHQSSVDSLEKFIPKLLEKGYEFVTVSELYDNQPFLPNYSYYSHSDYGKVQ